MKSPEQLETQPNIVIGIILAVVVVMMLIVAERNQVIERQAEQITRLQAENDYLNGHYKEKLGYLIEHGRRRYVRMVSIDGGRHWFEVSQHREVLQPPYIHQRYPDQKIIEIEIINPWSDESEATSRSMAGR